MFVINKYMERKNISLNLQMKIREYLRFVWKEELTQNQKIEEKIINTLSKSLKEELFLEAHGSVLNKYPMFFANFSDSTLRQLIYKMQEIRLTPEDLIFSDKIKDECEIYFITKGKVQLFICDEYDKPNKEKTTTLQELQVVALKRFHSLYNFYKYELPRASSARSKDYTTLFLIKRSDFLDILKQNSDDYEKFCMIRDQILLENKFNSINLKCFACKQNNHLTLNCPYLHYIPDRDRIIRIYNFNPHQKHRKRYQRRADKSLNALYDKIPIKLSQKKFKEYLKHYNLMEDLSGSFDSFDLMTEKELFEMEKLKSPKNLEENTLNLNPNSYNIQHEKPLGIFSKINEDLNEESSLKDIIYKKEEEEKIFSECLVENFLNKSNTIFRTKANLEINTNNSKSKNIIEIRKKRRSVSSKYNENFSFISPNKNNEISRVSKNKFGRLNFKYEDLDSSNFRIPKKRENSAEYRKNNLSLIEKGFENISKQPQSIIFNGLEMGNSVENSNSPNHEIKRKESYKKVNLAESDVYFKKLSNPFAIKKQFSLCSNKTVEKSPLLKLPIHHTISQNEMKKKNEDRDDNNTMNETLSIRETNEAETALILNTKEMRFETVHNFKNYYPYNNIKEIIQSFIILKKKKRKDKRKKTMKFKNYFIEKQQKKKNSIEQNQILPMSEANNLFTDVNLDKDPQKRASNIFIDRSITMNFFKKPATKYTFYDIVYEVLKNKDLRKNLRDMRDKSQKNKFRNRLNIN